MYQWAQSDRHVQLASEGLRAANAMDPLPSVTTELRETRPPPMQQEGDELDHERENGIGR